MEPITTTPKKIRRWILLGAAVLLAFAVFWLLLPVRKAVPAELLPDTSFAYLSCPLDRSDPAVQAIVSALKARLTGPGSGFSRRALVSLLLPAALPRTVTVVFAADGTAGEPAILIFADVGRLARIIGLFGGRVDGILLRGGPVAKDRLSGRRYAYIPGKSGGFSPSAYAMVDDTLVMGTNVEVLKDCLARSGGVEPPAVPAASLASRLAQSLGGRDVVLYVDNAGGGMSRLVAAASEKYAFAAFPTIDAVSSISARIELHPDAMSGSAAFECSKPEMIQGVESDVRFLYGAFKRVARASGANMTGDVSVSGGVVVFKFEIPDYIQMIEGDKE